MSKTFNLAVIGGDGIGPEVVAEGLKVLDVVASKYGVSFNKTSYELGAKYWHKTGETLPDAVLDELAKADVILLGAVGDPTVPSGVLERGLLLKLRFAFDHFINLRPAKLHAGVKSPLATDKEIDFIVPVGRDCVHLIECKWKSNQVDLKSIKAFREDYPKGENFLVTSDAHLQSSNRMGDLNFKYLNIAELIFVTLILSAPFEMCYSYPFDSFLER